MTTITIPKKVILPDILIRRKQGIAILPLEEYERMKEDLEMFQSRNLAKDIEKARKEKKTISLEKLLKEHNF